MYEFAKRLANSNYAVVIDTEIIPQVPACQKGWEQVYIQGLYYNYDSERD